MLIVLTENNDHPCEKHDWYTAHYIIELSYFLIPFVVVGVKLSQCHYLLNKLKSNVIANCRESDERKEVILFIKDQMKRNSPFRIHILWMRVNPTIPAMSGVVSVFATTVVPVLTNVFRKLVGLN